MKFLTFFLLFFVCLEVSVRLFWVPPSVDWVNKNEYVKLNLPLKSYYYFGKKLYEDIGLIRLKTGSFGEILSNKERLEKPLAFAMGGSTTQCAFVDQGGRWPDLIESFDVLNFGVSGNALGDTYFNLKFLLKKYPEKPKAIFFLHAINDLNMYKLFKFNAIQTDMNEWANRRKNENSMFKVNLVKFENPLSVITWAKFFIKEVLVFFANIQLDLLDSYVASRESNLKKSVLSDEEFEKIKEEEIMPFLPYRKKAFEHFYNIARESDVDIILLTQPHAFDKDYMPKNGLDLRQYPFYGDRNASIEQSAELMGFVNEQTRSLAKKYSLKLIDISAEFKKRKLSELLYDSVHYTEKGSRLIGELINESL